MGKRHYVLCILILLALMGVTSGMVRNVSAATYTPGVKVGSWWNWHENYTGTPVEENIQVIYVYGGQVTVNITSGGSSSVYSLYVDNPRMVVRYPLLAGDLNVGDSIGPGNALKINSSTTKDYAGGSRLVNIAIVSGGGGHYIDYYDKETGVLCEETLITGNTSQTILLLTDTNLWGNGTQLLLLAALVGFAVTLVAVIGIVAYKKKSKNA